MPLIKLLVCLCGLSFLSGCAAVAVGGAVVGTAGTVVGTTVKTTTKVAGGAVKLAIPDGDDEED
ncbi:hypothetical protein [Labrenzia sp. PHM005]|uniref:hypothetical protein n=1 Tax=Stappiaceae TaxID=2821832 RepID=UPI00113FF03C|nr:hypothetical protein [Labrenzia sp. PHM005]QDG77511.1 hypothetical protein FJ695_17465 [Labrenzia sp. PHM005]